MHSRTPLSILIVDDDEVDRSYVQTLLRGFHRVEGVATGDEAVKFVSTRPVDLVLLDLVLGDTEDGLAVLQKLKEVREEVDVVMISGVRLTAKIVEAMRLGASDYITKPVGKEEILLTLNRVMSKRTLMKTDTLVREKFLDRKADEEIIGRSEAIEEIKRMIAQLRGQEANVFLVGETGTGKEMFARRLHRQENDPHRPFISVNCAAIPENLLESVLFGHEKGSFTGATERRTGKFELADGGDIFLDEISCMSLELQAKLLRVLEEREVERIGSARPRKVSFRAISASNENIHRLVANGRFRQDLFYRLNTVTIELPSLADRPEDIVPLAEHFLDRCKKTPKPKLLSPEVEDLLIRHHWRGNVRELRNTVENMVIFSKGDTIVARDVPFLRQNGIAAPAAVPALGAELDRSGVLDQASFLTGTYQELLTKFERDLIVKRLEKNRWSKTRTCRDMGITRNKLYRMMATLEIEL